MSKWVLLIGGTGFLGTAIRSNIPAMYNVVAPEHHVLDLCTVSSLRNLAEKGAFCAVINAAGVHSDSLLSKMPDAEWGRVLDTNLTGNFRLLRALRAPGVLMEGSRIVLLGSAARGGIGISNYVASKAGLSGLVEAAASEFAPSKTAVNVVSPGFIQSPMVDALPAKVRYDVLARTPLHRFGTAEEVAALVTWLALEAPLFITGQSIRIDGGWKL